MQALAFVGRQTRTCTKRFLPTAAVNTLFQTPPARKPGGSGVEADELVSRKQRSKASRPMHLKITIYTPASWPTPSPGLPVPRRTWIPPARTRSLLQFHQRVQKTPPSPTPFIRHQGMFHITPTRRAPCGGLPHVHAAGDLTHLREAIPGRSVDSGSGLLTGQEPELEGQILQKPGCPID